MHILQPYKGYYQFLKTGYRPLINFIDARLNSLTRNIFIQGNDQYFRIQRVFSSYNNQKENKSFRELLPYLFLSSIFAISTNHSYCEPHLNSINFFAETKQWAYPGQIYATSHLTKGKALLQKESGHIIFSFLFAVKMFQPGRSILCQTNARISFEGIDRSGNILWKTESFDFQSSYLGEKEFVFEKNLNKEILEKTDKIRTVFHCEKPQLDYA